MELAITFSHGRCSCGAKRQAGHRCADCSREPDEVDPDLERRRAIVNGVRDCDPVANVEPLDLESWGCFY